MINLLDIQCLDGLQLDVRHSEGLGIFGYGWPGGGLRGGGRQFLAVDRLDLLTADHGNDVAEAGTQVLSRHAHDLKIPLLIQGGTEAQDAPPGRVHQNEMFGKVHLRHRPCHFPGLPKFFKFLGGEDELRRHFHEGEVVNGAAPLVYRFHRFSL
jgi:hypothetical protein